MQYSYAHKEAHAETLLRAGLQFMKGHISGTAKPPLQNNLREALGDYHAELLLDNLGRRYGINLSEKNIRPKLSQGLESVIRQEHGRDYDLPIRFAVQMELATLSTFEVHKLTVANGHDDTPSGRDAIMDALGELNAECMAHLARIRPGRTLQ